MKKAKKIIIEITALLVSLCILLGATSYLGYRFMPLREDYGATWNMFLEEQEDSVDVLFVGSSMIYCDIIPAKLYEKTGHTSYLLSAPYMMPDVAYYYLKEALRTQSPDLVMVEATSFYFSTKEADYYKVNYGYMPYSLNRLEASLFAAPNDEKLGLLFPMFNYHQRWEDYSLGEIFSKREDARPDLMAGYTLLEKEMPQKKRYERQFLCDEEDYNRNIVYLHKITELCKEEDIELEFFIVPACEYVNEERTQKIRDERDDIKVTNFNDVFEELDLLLESDFYDARHVNINGAIKFTDYLADYITQSYELEKSSHDEALWQKRVEHINEIKG